ncbi:MAG: copper chaperone PCu(A)C [Gallionellaceae bacterium]|jgi:copper(I)-binding protein
MGPKNWLGLCALLLSLQVNSSEINIQDPWIRPLATGQEDAMVGMVINSDRQARVISVISPAFKFVAIKGPGKDGANTTREFEFIELPAQKSVVLDAESTHLLLSGNRHTLGTDDNVPVIISIQFDDRTSRVITVMAQSVLNRSGAAKPSISNTPVQPVAAVLPVAPPNPVETPKKATPPPPATIKAKASTAVAPKKPVAEVKPLKAAPVAARAATTPAPVAAPAPVALSAPAVAPLTVEPKKAPEAKPAEQPKQEEAEAADECFSLSIALRDCDKSNDMMIEWCTTNAKSKYSCKLTMEQLKKLGK